MAITIKREICSVQVNLTRNLSFSCTICDGFPKSEKNRNSNFTPLIPCTHFVVKIVQIPRSPIFEAMGHTSVFPIDENKVAEVVVLFSQQNHFIVRVGYIQRSMKNPSDG